MSVCETIGDVEEYVASKIFGEKGQLDEFIGWATEGACRAVSHDYGAGGAVDLGTLATVLPM